jgi:hypothetical protein
VSVGITLCVDLLGAVLRKRADGGDAVALDADVRLDRSAPRAVNDGATTDDQVELSRHRTSPFSFAGIVRRPARFVTTPSPAKRGRVGEGGHRGSPVILISFDPDQCAQTPNT